MFTKNTLGFNFVQVNRIERCPLFPQVFVTKVSDFVNPVVYYRMEDLHSEDSDDGWFWDRTPYQATLHLSTYPANPTSYPSKSVWSSYPTLLHVFLTGMYLYVLNAIVVSGDLRPPRCRRGNELDWIARSGFDSRLTPTACGSSDGKEVKDVFGCPASHVEVGSAR